MDIEQVAKRLYHIDHPNIHDWSGSNLKELYRVRADQIIPIVEKYVREKIKGNRYGVGR